MTNNYDKLLQLTEKLDKKLADISSSEVNLFSFEPTIEKNNDTLSRESNIKRLQYLFDKLEINKKCSSLEELYFYKAMNLSGMGLQENDFGEIRAGKYIQIIAISYEIGTDERKKAKNVSLGYFGNGANLTDELKNNILELVLRWRYEKGFQGQDHYKMLLNKVTVY